MVIKFLKISRAQANVYAANPNLEYTPFLDPRISQYYFYKDSYTTIELRSTVDLLDSHVDGLTPIDPTKPMFPRKK